MRADNALKSAINNNDAQAFDYYDDQPAKIVKEVPQEDVLCDALLQIVNGNYNRVNDSDLSAIINQLEPFMEYASIRTSMKRGYK
jgi:hypothetical protein